MMIVPLLVAGAAIASAVVQEGSNAAYDTLAKGAPRSQPVFVLWTSPENGPVKCPTCKPVDKIFEKMAGQWPSARFVRMHLGKCDDAFKRRGLAMVPAVEFYPSCSAMCPPPKTFNARDTGFTYSALADFAAANAGPLPASPLRVVLLIGLLAVAVGSVAYAWNPLVRLARNPWMASIISTVLECHINVRCRSWLLSCSAASCGAAFATQARS